MERTLYPIVILRIMENLKEQLHTHIIRIYLFAPIIIIISVKRTTAQEYHRPPLQQR